MKKQEVKATVILLSSLIVSILVISVFVNYFDFSDRKGIIYFIIFLAYLIISVVLSSKVENNKNKIVRALIYLFSFPMSVIYLVLQFGAPFMALIMNLAIYIVASSLPFVIILFFQKFFAIDFSREKLIFLLLTIISITAVTFNKLILEIIYKRSPAINNQSKAQAKRTKELTQYIFKRNNIRFGIYLLYFCFLIFYTLNHLDGSENLVNFSILQAFLIFLAYDSIIINSKEISILPSKILSKVLFIFLADAEDEIRAKENKEAKPHDNQ